MKKINYSMVLIPFLTSVALATGPGYPVPPAPKPYAVPPNSLKKKPMAVPQPIQGTPAATITGYSKVPTKGKVPRKPAKKTKPHKTKAKPHKTHAPVVHSAAPTKPKSTMHPTVHKVPKPNKGHKTQIKNKVPKPHKTHTPVVHPAAPAKPTSTVHPTAHKAPKPNKGHKTQIKNKVPKQHHGAKPVPMTSHMKKKQHKLDPVHHDKKIGKTIYPKAAKPAAVKPKVNTHAVSVAPQKAKKPAHHKVVKPGNSAGIGQSRRARITEGIWVDPRRKGNSNYYPTVLGRSDRTHIHGRHKPLDIPKEYIFLRVDKNHNAVDQHNHVIGTVTYVNGRPKFKVETPKQLPAVHTYGKTYKNPFKTYVGPKDIQQGVTGMSKIPAPTVTIKGPKKHAGTPTQAGVVATRPAPVSTMTAAPVTQMTQVPQTVGHPVKVNAKGQPISSVPTPTVIYTASQKPVGTPTQAGSTTRPAPVSTMTAAPVSNMAPDTVGHPLHIPKSGKGKQKGTSAKAQKTQQSVKQTNKQNAQNLHNTKLSNKQKSVNAGKTYQKNKTHQQSVKQHKQTTAAANSKKINTGIHKQIKGQKTQQSVKQTNKQNAQNLHNTKLSNKQKSVNAGKTYQKNKTHQQSVKQHKQTNAAVNKQNTTPIRPTGGNAQPVRHPGNPVKQIDPTIVSGPYKGLTASQAAKINANKPPKSLQTGQQTPTVFPKKQTGGNAQPTIQSGPYKGLTPAQAAQINAHKPPKGAGQQTPTITAPVNSVVKGPNGKPIGVVGTGKNGQKVLAPLPSTQGTPTVFPKKQTGGNAQPTIQSGPYKGLTPAQAAKINAHQPPKGPGQQTPTITAPVGSVVKGPNGKPIGVVGTGKNGQKVLAPLPSVQGTPSINLPVGTVVHNKNGKPIGTVVKLSNGQKGLQPILPTHATPGATPNATPSKLPAGSIVHNKNGVPIGTIVKLPNGQTVVKPFTPPHVTQTVPHGAGTGTGTAGTQGTGSTSGNAGGNTNTGGAHGNTGGSTAGTLGNTASSSNSNSANAKPGIIDRIKSFFGINRGEKTDKIIEPGIRNKEVEAYRTNDAKKVEYKDTIRQDTKGDILPVDINRTHKSK